MHRIAKLARENAFATAVGFSGGACVGLVGWGGAQFIIPGVAYMGHSQLAAAGVSLCSVSVSSISGAAKFMASDSVSPSHALGMAVPAVITARFGSVLAKRLTDVQLQLAFNGLSAALIPTYLAVQHYAQNRDAETEAAQDAAAPLRRTLTEHRALHRSADAECDAEARGPAGLASRLLPLRAQDMAFGALSGVLSSLVGVGGLPIAMSYLTVSTDLPHHLVQGTAVLAVAPSVLVSALSRLSVIPVVTTVAVCGGAACGASAGASVALRTSEERLRQLFMLSLVVLGGRSFVGAVGNLRTMWLARLKR